MRQRTSRMLLWLLQWLLLNYIHLLLLLLLLLLVHQEFNLPIPFPCALHFHFLSALIHGIAGPRATSARDRKSVV